MGRLKFLSADAVPLESTYLKESTSFRALRGMHNATVVLLAGFTTIRDVGNSGDYAMQDVRRAIANGLFLGPTVIDSGKIIAPFGGQSHDIPQELGRVWTFDYLDADGGCGDPQGHPYQYLLRCRGAQIGLG
jgi:hypothetical protein